VRALAVTAFVLFAAACARKAPGPVECRQFALIASGARTFADLQNPKVAEIVDRLTVECLVTPYDRELLRCTEETGRVRACSLEFERRRRRKD
jgi:hypothetical protein